MRTLRRWARGWLGLPESPGLMESAAVELRRLVREAQAARRQYRPLLDDLAPPVVSLEMQALRSALVALECRVGELEAARTMAAR